MYTTVGGQETELMYKHGHELPDGLAERQYPEQSGVAAVRDAGCPRPRVRTLRRP